MVMTSSLHPSAPGLIGGGVGEGMENLVLTGQGCNFLMWFIWVFLQMDPNPSLMLAGCEFKGISLKWFYFNEINIGEMFAFNVLENSKGGALEIIFTCIR